MSETKQNTPNKRLEIALALNRGLEYLQEIQPKAASGTAQHDQARKSLTLLAEFQKIHAHLFQDTHGHPDDPSRAGHPGNSAANEALREALIGLTGANNGHGKTRSLFDANGLVPHEPKTVAEVLAQAYITMRKTPQFDYGNTLTTNLLFVAISRLPAFREVYPQGIDFRRLDAADVQAMHENPPALDALRTAFTHALDTARTRTLENPRDGFGKWGDNKEFIAAMPFLAADAEVNGKQIRCLVTVEGGLVPLDEEVDGKTPIRAELQAHIRARKPVSSFPPLGASRCIGYLPGTEKLRTQNMIDNIRIRPETRDANNQIIDERAAPLFCLDVNMLTGLSPMYHEEFLNFLAQQKGKDYSPFNLNKKQPLQNLESTDTIEFSDDAKQLIAAAPDQLKQVVKIACDRITCLTNLIDTKKDEMFKDRTPAAHGEKPHLFMSMGGAGVGKTASQEIARSYCGNNFVEASMDKAREQSDLYNVMRAANHHGDDYIFIEPFASTFRQWVVAHALNEKQENGNKARYNLLFDGTGIDYAGRYDKDMAKFKKAGFQTFVCAMDTMLTQAPGREEECPLPARQRVLNRAKEGEKRALPWIVVTGKHTRALRSFLQAVNDLNVDKAMLFCNDGGPGQHYLLAETFDKSAAETGALLKAQREERLAPLLAKEITAPGSITHRLSDGDRDSMAQRLQRIPQFSEGNVSVLAQRIAGHDRVLAVTNTTRFVDFAEKGLFNAQASSPEALLHKPADLAFDVTPDVQHDTDVARLRLQQPGAEYTAEVARTRRIQPPVRG